MIRGGKVFGKDVCPLFPASGARIVLVSFGLAAAGLVATSPMLLGQDEKAFLQMGVDAQKKGDFDAALLDFNTSIYLNPKFAPAYLQRGGFYAARGDYDKAIADCDQAILLNPNSADAYLFRGIIDLAKGDTDKGITDFTRAIRLSPKLAKAHLYRGIAYNMKNNSDAAIIELSSAIQLDPTREYAPYIVRGLVYEGKKDYDKAIKDFDQAILLNPVADAYNDRGATYADKGDWDKAIGDYDQAIRLDANYAPAYGNLAWLLATCPQAGFRDGKKAVEYATRACELSQWKRRAMIDTLAAACAEAEDFKNAVKWESQYLGTPNLNAKARADAQSRLALYQAQKAYHEGKGTGIF